MVRDELEKEKIRNANSRDIDRISTSSEDASNNENQSESTEIDIMRTQLSPSEDNLASSEGEHRVARRKEQIVSRKVEKIHKRAAFTFIRPGPVLKIRDVNTVLINPSTI